MKMSEKDIIHNVLQMTPTFILAMPRCPFCTKAIAALPSAKVYDYLEYPELDSAITDVYSYKTYPKIFLEGEFIGGYSDLVSRNSAL
ncbi:GRX1 [Enterospora canceri]|uniref:GRX1 n=1 Tax=Enterospora canceri TaxID=1081671 RepID=A0A1Y1S5M9_9MICR|nr:GRX1 [Enterospora canceri]